jgi:hypothetical protein
MSSTSFLVCAASFLEVFEVRSQWVACFPSYALCLICQKNTRKRRNAGAQACFAASPTSFPISPTVHIAPTPLSRSCPPKPMVGLFQSEGGEPRLLSIGTTRMTHGVLEPDTGLAEPGSITQMI